jgi:hypothetical protein
MDIVGHHDVVVRLVTESAQHLPSGGIGQNIEVVINHIQQEYRAAEKTISRLHI